METKRCHGCDRSSHSLLTANCGHKTCFYCIKNNKSANKCSKCSAENSHTSPLKNKSGEKSPHLRSQQTRVNREFSPALETQRHEGSTRKKQLSEEYPPVVNNLENNCLLCPDHKQPLTMFNKNTKQILCSICLCSKSRYHKQILPLKNAEQFLRKQNRIYREQARVALSEVENAWRIVNKNAQTLQSCIESQTAAINEFFDDLVAQLRLMQENSVKLCSNYLTNKIGEYGEISEDLSYLAETLKIYRKNNRDSTTLNELTYLYTSFNVIKKTLKGLSFDYIPYERKNVNLVEFDRDLAQTMQNELIKFKFNLNLKVQQKNKSRSASSKPNKINLSPDFVLKKHKLDSSPKKHKFSLCSNGSMDYVNEDGNLYKKLLKAKYKF